MNRVYRVIWNSIAGCWQAVAETARAKGKSGRQKADSCSITGKASLSPALRLAVIGFAATGAWAAPQGGQVTAGNAIILKNGATTTINQSSQNAAINWQSFSVGKSEAVRFNQPNASAITLNRVTGRESSQILGNLTANGRVFILNPNGVLIGNGAQVNVGGLVASTGKMSDADFLAGNYKISDAQGSVINAGNISAASGGVVALIAPVVQNTGTIAAPQGSTLLAGAQAVTLKLQDGSLIGYTLDQGSLQTLVDNGGIIQAEGGHVVLTAKGLDALSKATINHSGVIEAQTVSSKSGVVELLGDMGTGEINLSGKIDASAPNGGDGGFVETSASRVYVSPTTKVTTLSASGKTGQWLIDPVDFTIASAGGDMTGATLSALLQSSNMEIQSVAGGSSGHGDLFVNDVVSWTANTVLSLDAERNVNINAPITGTGTSAGIAINPEGGDYYFGPDGKITLPGDSATFSVMGNPYHVIHDVNQLQIVQNFPASRYVLGNDISAAATAGWNGGEGFVPIGSIERGVFSGIFDGLGHTIDQLTIQRPTETFVGLFGYTNPGARISNVGVTNANISGYQLVGGLLGFGFVGTKVSNSYTTGSVTGVYEVGGLVGENHGDIVASHSSAALSGENVVGGLIGYAAQDSVVSSSHASGAVAASSETAGGLIGYNSGIVTASHTSGNISGVRYIGGLLGGNGGNVSTSYATGSVTADYVVGGLVGYSIGNVETSLATGPVTGLWHVGGLLGDNYGSVVNSRTSGSASGDDAVGGLVGYNDGTVVNSHVAGTVNGSSQVGGLVGFSGGNGSVTGSYATGNVTGTNVVGGLLGTNRGVVETSYATGSVSGSDTVGGLVGLNEGTVNTSHATGTVRGSRYDAGGLVGENLGDVSRSYATGEVTGVNIVGGLVGDNDSGIITESYATGAVAGSQAVGGLAGDNSGDIRNTYASGRVTGPDESGGLVGTNSGTISTSYARGAVTGAPDQGGLVGYNEGDVNASYWDTQTSGLTYSDGGTGKTTLQMTRAATFAGWDFAGTWTITEGSSYPTLRAVPASAPASPVTPSDPPVTTNPGSDPSSPLAEQRRLAEVLRLQREAASAQATRGQNVSESTFNASAAVDALFSGVSAILSDSNQDKIEALIDFNHDVNKAVGKKEPESEFLKTLKSIQDFKDIFSDKILDTAVYGGPAALLFTELEVLNKIISNTQLSLSNALGNVVEAAISMAEYGPLGVVSGDGSYDQRAIISATDGVLALAPSVSGFSSGLGEINTAISRLFQAKSFFEGAKSAYGAVNKFKNGITDAVESIKSIGNGILNTMDSNKLLLSLESLATYSFRNGKVDGEWNDFPKLLELMTQRNPVDVEVAIARTVPNFQFAASILSELKSASGGNDEKFYKDATSLFFSMKSAYDASKTLMKLTSTLDEYGINYSEISLNSRENNQLVVQAAVIKYIREQHPDDWQSRISGMAVRTPQKGWIDDGLVETTLK